jgi:integrase
MTLRTEKTDEVVRVPLMPKALELIPPRTMEGMPVFRVRDNNTTNNHLREIMALQGIGKGITMHSGRHTFATCSLDLGIPLEVVSKILGHTDTRTTAIYARIRDGLKEKEMRKWTLDYE